MNRNQQGFDYPIVDTSMCIDCGACKKACPQLAARSVHNSSSNSNVYLGGACVASETMQQSSSGGIAYALAKFILDKGGVVFGAVYSGEMQVNHVAITDQKDLFRLQGSKYVQSSIGNTYHQAKERLDNGQTVLFFGVGCQIAGLYSYLNSTVYPNLITCDLLCGGGTSPGLFEHYIRFLEVKYRMSIQDYCFRDKQYGYGLYLCSIREGRKKKFVRGSDGGFVRTMGAGYVRESCFQCPYASMERQGDISLGDFWNVQTTVERQKSGVSLILTNSQKGELLLREMQPALVWLEERTWEEALASQGIALRGGKRKPDNYDAFFQNVYMQPWNDVYKMYLRSTSPKMEILDAVPACMAGGLLELRRLVRKHGK